MNVHWTQTLIMMIVIVSFIAMIEIFALLALYLSVAKYESFWNDKANKSGELTYLALGDSTAQGIGASSPMLGYVGLVAKRLEDSTGKSIRIINLSKTGGTMEDYLNDQDPAIAGLKPDIVTIEIGANDIKNFDAATYRSQFKKVLASLPDGTYVSNMPHFNSRPGSTQAGKDASEIIRQELAAYPKLNFVDLQTETEQNQSVLGFAPDLFHPNNRTYKHWARAFLQAIEPNISDLTADK